MTTPVADPLIVASVPGRHVYVRHLAAEVEERVTRLPDPDPDDPRRPAQQTWWPPVMLDPDWIAREHFDVFHLQFGFDAWSPEGLQTVVDALRRKGTPIVYTVHDLRNPHHEDRTLHDAQLDVLVPAADALVTLTEGAAEEITMRWGRTAHVVPHPHVVDLATMARVALRGERSRRRGPRIGLHVKSLRASMNPLELLSTILAFVSATPHAVLQVNGHRDVLEPDGARYDAHLARQLRLAADRGLVDLHVHDFMTDAELYAYLASLDVSVLPYRFGTHSGWLEACRDVGTTVVAPDCGYYADQAPVFSYRNDGIGFDGSSLRAALEDAVAHPGWGAATVAERRAQRARIADFHADLYASLVR
ncbi:glycosyltransferase [Nocardioides hwasunensis]|uniref:Glycosyltransferase n=1 Tax=Nocardioides hwasunensis TaxID=397258 RepID=A0ABR8MHX1_9ACTN|nr:glycosyltransferase [Nocardioides hwasunensis]MBD3914851.1 glycosyltransferase [Nocardioides hwasunensis]